MSAWLAITVITADLSALSAVREIGMRQLTRVTVTMQELDWLMCIQAVVDGDLKAIRAAERLGLTTRQVRRGTFRTPNCAIG
jgi:hypothetical protein